MAETDLKVWYNSIPKITRFWFTLLVIFPVASRLGLVSPKWLILDWNLVVNQFQIWRLVTCALWLPTSFNYLVILYFVYTYSYGLEAGYFSGRPAEYVYLLLFSLINCVICGFLFEFPMLMPMSMFVVLYIWCMVNPDEIVSFWFGTKFKAVFFPWIMFAFNFIISGGVLDLLCGIVVGHLYFFLKFKYPRDFGGVSLLETPQFMYKLFPNVRTVAGFGTPTTIRPRQDAAADDGNRWGGHRWGQGRRLND